MERKNDPDESTDIVRSLLLELADELDKPCKISERCMKGGVGCRHKVEKRRASDDDSDHMDDLTDHIRDALNISIKHGNQNQQIDILKFMVQENLASSELIKRMVSSWVHSNSDLLDTRVPSCLLSLRNALLAVQGSNLNEALLLCTIQQASQGMFSDALLSAFPSLKGLASGGVRQQEPNPALAACGLLFDAYRLILSQHNSKQAMDLDGLRKAGEESFLHLVAEPYVYLLVFSELEDEAEEFVKRTVTLEMSDRPGKSGLSPIFAYEIIQAHMPRASIELKQYVLECVAQVDPCNPLVLKLCRMYQKSLSSSPRKNRTRKKDDDADEGIDDANDGIRSLTEAESDLAKGLAIVFGFLDQLPPENETNGAHTPFHQAWNILADLLRILCQKRPHKDVFYLTQLWHVDRKDWWPSIHFRIPEDPNGKSITASLPDRALVCAILDSESNPFVVDVMAVKPSPLLVSLLGQLRPFKTQLDDQVSVILKKAKRLDRSKKASDSSARRNRARSKALNLSDAEFPPKKWLHPAIEIELGCQPGGDSEDSDSKESSDEGDADDEAEFDADGAPRPATLEVFNAPMKEALAIRSKRRRTMNPAGWDDIPYIAPSYAIKSLPGQASREESDSVSDDDGDGVPTIHWPERLRSAGRTDFCSIPELKKRYDKKPNGADEKKTKGAVHKPWKKLARGRWPTMQLLDEMMNPTRKTKRSDSDA